MSTKHILFIVTLFTLTAILSGCFSAKPEDIEVFLEPGQADVTMDDYILQPPDSVIILASKIPELQGGDSGEPGQTQVIRPDGKISFENIGEIEVAGKTPRQVAEIMGQKLAELYKLTGDHPVDVRVVNQSKYYYVAGMVSRPGAQIFSGRETTLSALTKAIPNNLAWKEKIQVIRPSVVPGQPSKVFALNWKKMFEQGQMHQNVLLQEGDVIYVPPTILASIGLTAAEIFAPILSGAGAYSAIGAP